VLDELISQIEKLQSEGAIVLLKWDGERGIDRCTVVVTRKDTDYVFRLDSDSMQAALRGALTDYSAKHQG
jgi:hypothetical protein